MVSTPSAAEPLDGGNEAGESGDGDLVDTDAQDINSLVLADKDFTIEGLASRFSPEKITKVTLLGHSGTIDWKRDRAGLTITTPSTKPCDHAFVFRLDTE